MNTASTPASAASGRAFHRICTRSSPAPSGGGGASSARTRARAARLPPHVHRLHPRPFGRRRGEQRPHALEVGALVMQVGRGDEADAAGGTKKRAHETPPLRTQGGGPG